MMFLLYHSTEHLPSQSEVSTPTSSSLTHNAHIHKQKESSQNKR